MNISKNALNEVYENHYSGEYKKLSAWIEEYIDMVLDGEESSSFEEDVFCNLVKLKVTKIN